MINGNQKRKCNGDSKDTEGNYFPMQYDVLSDTLNKSEDFRTTFSVKLINKPFNNEIY